MEHLGSLKEFAKANPKKVAAGSLFMLLCLWLNKTQYHNILLAKWLIRLETETKKNQQEQQDELKRLQNLMKKLGDFFSSYHLNRLTARQSLVSSSGGLSFHPKLLRFVVLEPFIQFFYFVFQLQLLKHEESFKSVSSAFMRVPEVLSELFEEVISVLQDSFDKMVHLKFSEIFEMSLSKETKVERHLKDVVMFMCQLVPFESKLWELLNFSKENSSQKPPKASFRKRVSESLALFIENLGLSHGKIYVEPKLMQVTIELVRSLEQIEWISGDRKAFDDKIKELWSTKYGLEDSTTPEDFKKILEACKEVMTGSLDLLMCADGQIISREMVYASGKMFTNRVMLAESQGLFRGKSSEKDKLEVYTKIIETSFVSEESFSQKQELYSQKIKEMMAIGKQLEMKKGKEEEEEEKKENDEEDSESENKETFVKLAPEEREKAIMLLNVYKEFQMDKHIQVSLHEFTRKVYLGSFFEKYFLPSVYNGSSLSELASENLENLLEAFS